MNSSYHHLSTDNNVVTSLLSDENSLFDGFNSPSMMNVEMESIDIITLPFPLAQASNSEVDAFNTHMMGVQNTRHPMQGVAVYESNNGYQNSQIYNFEGLQVLEEPEHIAYVDRQYSIQPEHEDVTMSFQQNQVENFYSLASQPPTLTEQTLFDNGPYQSTDSVQDIRRYGPTHSSIYSDDRSVNPTISSVSTTLNPVIPMIPFSSTDPPPTSLDSQNSLNELNLLAPAASSEFSIASNLNNPVNKEIKLKFDLYDSLHCMRRQALSTSPRFSRSIPCPSYPGIGSLRAVTPKVIQRSDLQGEKCDIQGINWKEIGVSRSKVKSYRKKQYLEDIGNLKSIYPNPKDQSLTNWEKFFRFRRMDFNHKVQLLHVQLRNLISSPTRDHVFYAGGTKVFHYTPHHAEKSAIASIALDLTNPSILSPHSTSQGIHITTMATGQNLLVAGGGFGEYGLVNLNAEKGTDHTQGLITREPQGMINHIQIYSTRTNASPIVAFASNDSHLRLLDVQSNRVVSEHPFKYAINCSSISTDKRLRVMVGDMQQILICNAESGEILKTLKGHSISGHACDWADDGWTVATGGQDQKIKIWDARKWTTTQGAGLPVAVISTQMVGVSKLKFSPLGSGKRILVAAEPVDYLNIIEAERFSDRQTISLFGDITGFDFCNGGQDLYVANSDSTRGGIMEFERSDLASNSRYEIEFRIQSEMGRSGNLEPYDWKNEGEMIRDLKTRETPETLERRCVYLGEPMGHF
ncbi:putative WD repeat-containing protein C2A9.03 [Erysiphe neolycopersici]|uniref:Putative WD repeat-containing protein C2A9.03 n=1 Tax=Erysiphe neolycopersici TaxID=212602 RepID=A0A420HAG1_9PEZI|nr:putative WD repeat-containing protein C2A9.03 [Erysiphe neolycopersici]